MIIVVFVNATAEITFLHFGNEISSVEEFREFIDIEVPIGLFLSSNFAKNVIHKAIEDKFFPFEYKGHKYKDREKVDIKINIISVNQIKS